LPAAPQPPESSPGGCFVHPEGSGRPYGRQPFRAATPDRSTPTRSHPGSARLHRRTLTITSYRTQERTA